VENSISPRNLKFQPEIQFFTVEFEISRRKMRFHRGKANFTVKNAISP